MYGENWSPSRSDPYISTKAFKCHNKIVTIIMAMSHAYAEGLDEEKAHDIEYVRDEFLSGDTGAEIGNKPHIKDGRIGSRQYVSRDMEDWKNLAYLAVDTVRRMEDTGVQAPEVTYDEDADRILVPVAGEDPTPISYFDPETADSIDPSQESFNEARALKRIVCDNDVNPLNLLVDKCDGQVYPVDFEYVATGKPDDIESYLSSADELGLANDRAGVAHRAAEIAHTIDEDDFVSEFRKRVEESDMAVDSTRVDKISNRITESLRHARNGPTIGMKAKDYIDQTFAIA